MRLSPKVGKFARIARERKKKKMLRIKRNIIVTEINETTENNLPYCQASINSNGNITLRNHNGKHKETDEIIILSRSETTALFELFSMIGQKVKGYTLPF